LLPCRREHQTIKRCDQRIDPICHPNENADYQLGLPARNDADKQALRDLRSFEYPELRDRVLKLMPQWESDSQRWQMDTVFMKFDVTMKSQEEIMTQLVTFDNYDDPSITFLAADVIENQVIPQTAES
jgi:hypothetical protein